MFRYFSFLQMGRPWPVGDYEDIKRFKTDVDPFSRLFGMCSFFLFFNYHVKIILLIKQFYFFILDLIYNLIL